MRSCRSPIISLITPIVSFFCRRGGSSWEACMSAWLLWYRLANTLHEPTVTRMVIQRLICLLLLGHHTWQRVVYNSSSILLGAVMEYGFPDTVQPSWDWWRRILGTIYQTAREIEPRIWWNHCGLKRWSRREMILLAITLTSPCLMRMLKKKKRKEKKKTINLQWVLISILAISGAAGARIASKIRWHRKANWQMTAGRLATFMIMLMDNSVQPEKCGSHGPRRSYHRAGQELPFDDAL